MQGAIPFHSLPMPDQDKGPGADHPALLENKHSCFYTYGQVPCFHQVKKLFTISPVHLGPPGGIFPLATSL